MAKKYFDKTPWWMYLGSEKAGCNTETVTEVLNAGDIQVRGAGKSCQRRDSEEEQLPAGREIQSCWERATVWKILGGPTGYLFSQLSLYCVSREQMRSTRARCA